MSTKKEQLHTIAYQGVPGAFSYMALRRFFPEADPVPRATFAEAIAAVHTGEADAAFLPIENSSAGRVASMHELLPESHLHIVAEYFFPIKHQLIAPKGKTLQDIRRVYSHPQALAQCADFIRTHRLEEVPFGDTAAAVRYVAEGNDPHGAAIASAAASELFAEVAIVVPDIHDRQDNMTRFLLLAPHAEPLSPHDPEATYITSIFYRVKNIPAALFKSLAGFATEKINIVKLESFVPMFDPHARAEFYLEFEGVPEQEAVARALEELGYYADRLTILGSYRADPLRQGHLQSAE